MRLGKQIAWVAPPERTLYHLILTSWLLLMCFHFSFIHEAASDDVGKMEVLKTRAQFPHRLI